ncbi:MAG: AI-2E family transporter [Caldilineaceae bacterium]|nr:AI-2E family transporter [Caldilineaceae bacterium]MBP8106194.1 AI-2E family transporter [Caldilineaceae bacterium]MBP8121125.1 AI-2E family transporter [Caldilineaceae bacterium]MBP9071518.1 AI-2E family transporter [Caldilineaceae bacterium]
MNSMRWTNTTKIIVSASLAAILIWLLVVFRSMISPTIVALLLTFILGYPVTWIQQRTGWTRTTAVIATYLLLLALLALTPVLIIPRLSTMIDSLNTALQELVIDLQTSSAGPLFSLGDFSVSLDSILQQVGSVLQNILSPAATGALNLAKGLTTGILSTVYVLVICFWLLKDSHKLQRYLMAQVPASYSEDVRRLATELGQIWSAFLRGQFVLALVVGVMTWIPFVILGVPNAGGLALLAGFMEFLPTVGPGISGAIGTVIVLFSGSTWIPINNFAFAIIIMVLYIIITQIESVYLIPRLVGRRVRLHPAVTFAGIINAAIVFGMLGVLLATPTIASARTLLSYVYRKLADLPPFDTLEPAHSSIRIRGVVGGNKIEAVVFSLDGVLTELDWSLADRWADRLHRLDRFLPRARRVSLGRSVMLRLEGGVNRSINTLKWLKLDQDLTRLEAGFDHLRGFGSPTENRLHKSVLDTLTYLATQGYQLALVSARPQADVDQILAHLGMTAQHFAKVITLNDVSHLPPHSDTVTQICADLHLAANRVLLVGDSDIDLRPARAMGLNTAGVLSGLGTESNLAEAHLLLERVDQLDEWL